MHFLIEIVPGFFAVNLSLENMFPFKEFVI